MRNEYLINAANAMKNYRELVKICRDVCIENIELVKEFLKLNEDEMVDEVSDYVPDFVLNIVDEYKKYYNTNIDKDELCIVTAYYIKHQVELNKELEEAE